jgi:MFS family permease
MFAARIARLLGAQLHYAWVVLAVMFLSALCAMGVRSAPGVIIVPLQREFGWSVSTISGAVSLNIILLGVLAPFMAGFMQSVGLKRTVMCCLSLLTTGMALSMFMTQPWQLYVTWGLMVGIGASAGSIGLATAIANRWFASRRGMVVGIMSSASAAGQLIFLPLLGAMAEWYGWQSVALTLAAAMAAVVCLLGLILAESPARIGQAPFGATQIAEPVTAQGSNPFMVTINGLKRGAKSLDFWLLAISFGICGFSTNGLIGTHLISYCGDNGIGQTVAATTLASLGVFSMIGANLSGWLTDRINPRYILFVVYSLRGLSLLILPFTDFSTTSLLIFAAFYGLDWIATGAPTYALTNQVFGERDAPVIIAWIYTAHQIGGASAAIMAGTVRDFTGSYMFAFMASGFVCLLASLLVLRIRKPMMHAAAA